MKLHISLGIPKPETAKETEDQLGSIDGMRRAITHAGYRDSALIHQCMMTADVQGMSGEDRYVLLAYHALRQLEDIWQQHSDAMSKIPMPATILKSQSPERREEKHG